MRAFISGKQGLKVREKGKEKHFWGSGNVGNQYSNFWEQGNKMIYFGGTREQVPPASSNHQINLKSKDT